MDTYLGHVLRLGDQDRPAAGLKVDLDIVGVLRNLHHPDDASDAHQLALGHDGGRGYKRRGSRVERHGDFKLNSCWTRKNIVGYLIIKASDGTNEKGDDTADV